VEIPDFIIHYSRGEPFRSLSGVPEGELAGVLRELNEANALGLARFSDPEYLPSRMRVERRLREQFINKGGRPTLNQHVYTLEDLPTLFSHKDLRTPARLHIEASIL
jgi:hypothetical protein